MPNHADNLPPGRRVLLVEDDPVSARFLVDALATIAWVDHAIDAATARDLAALHRYDLWLIDRNLPDCNGPQLLAALRASATGGAVVPAMALTADLDGEQHAQLLACGFSAAESKPISIERLLQRVAELIGKPAAVIWDDAAAARALGNQPQQWQALRQLLRNDLPAQCQRITTGLRADDLAAVRAELHRLRAACGFCGASELGQACLNLASTPNEDTLLLFQAACARVLAAP